MMTVGNAESSVRSYVSEPEGTPQGGLLLISEIWGLVDHIKDVADRFAADGYLVLAPDLMTDIGMTPEVAGEVLRALADPDPEQRSRAKVDFQSVVYPGTGHAFFNDSTPLRYNAHAATDAWNRTLAFLERNLNS